MMPCFARARALLCAGLWLCASLVQAQLPADVPAHTGSPVWRSADRVPPFYIAGSIHVLRDGDYPLPAALEQAFADSQVLVLEVALSEANLQSFGQQMLLRGLYRDGETLRDHVSPATLARLQALAAARQWPFTHWLLHKPWLLGINLMQLEFQRLGVSAGHGIDAHYYQRAVAAGKMLVALETVEQQVAALQAMEGIPADALLGRFLDDMAGLPSMLDNLVPAWRQGDYATIDRDLSADLRTHQPALYRTLLVERNRRWLEALEPLLRGSQPVLVLVGSAHLGGPDSLIAMLAERGYRFVPVSEQPRRQAP